MSVTAGTRLCPLHLLAIANVADIRDVAEKLAEGVAGKGSADPQRAHSRWHAVASATAQQPLEERRETVVSLAGKSGRSTAA
jgi:hypothetical protein